LTAGKYEWNVDNAVISVKQLLLAGVIKKMHEDLQADVLPKEIYPAYEYVNLNAANLSHLLPKTFFEEKEYVSDTKNACQCSESEDTRDCRELLHAKYSIPKTRCSDSKVLACTDETERLLDKRYTHNPPFLLQKELLYLVLLIMHRQIQNTISGGFMVLHRLREQTDVQAVTEIFAHELPMKAMQITLIEARQFNDFVKNRRVMNLKCPPKSIDTNQQNSSFSMHRDARQRAARPPPPGGWQAGSPSPSFPQGLETRRIRPHRHLRTSTLGAVVDAQRPIRRAASQPTATKGTPPAPTRHGSKASTHAPQAHLPIRRTSVPRSPNTSKQVGVSVSCAASQQTRA
jgi:hypothetical protein